MDNRSAAFPVVIKLAKLALTTTIIAGAIRIARERRRMEFDGKTVLISGASRGLGLELARAFAEEGADLVLLARDQARLTQTAKELQRYGIKVLTYPCDVSQRAQVR